MRHLLISVAALALTAGAALAQPDHDRGRDRGPEHRQDVGKASMGRDVQSRAQRELRGQNAPQPQRTAQGGGGPTSFTNQIQGQQPGPNGERPGPGNQGRGDRGNWQGRQQAAPQPQAVAPAAPLDQNRGNRQVRGDRDRNDRGNWQGRGDNRRDFGRDDNRRDWNRDRGGYRSGYNGPRRDFRNYSNYHRDWRPTRRFRAPAYRRPPGWYSARWTFGQILPSLFWGRDYWLDYRMYDLPAPPYGAVWVRVGNDALMIDDYSGEIITVAYNVFY